MAKTERISPSDRASHRSLMEDLAACEQMRAQIAQVEAITRWWEGQLVSRYKLNEGDRIEPNGVIRRNE